MRAVPLAVAVSPVISPASSKIPLKEGAAVADAAWIAVAASTATTAMTTAQTAMRAGAFTTRGRAASTAWHCHGSERRGRSDRLSTSGRPQGTPDSHDRRAAVRSGRCWARTSDLRLVETERRGQRESLEVTESSCLQGFLDGTARAAYPRKALVRSRGVRVMCA